MSESDPFPLAPDVCEQLRQTIQRRVRYHLQGTPAEEVRDIAQKAFTQVMTYVRQQGVPARPEGLACVVARRRAIDWIDRHVAEGTHVPIDDLADALPDGSGDAAELFMVREEAAMQARRVIDFFREHDADCLPLAMAKAVDTDLKTLARSIGESHDALRQRWSRCMRRLKDAIARGVADLKGMPGWGGGEA